MAVPPNYLQPLIGYAMNLLGKGNSAEQVAAYMERNNVYSMLPERDRQQALQYALSNQLAVAQLSLTSARQSLAGLLGKIIPTEENVGVRLVASVRDPFGVLKDAAITVNVPPNWTPDQITALAIEQINSGQYRPHTGHDCPGTVEAIAIVGIYEGGTENANLTVARPA